MSWWRSPCHCARCTAWSSSGVSISVGQGSRHRRSNVQAPIPNACSAFRRRTVSPFDPTNLDASVQTGRDSSEVLATHGLDARIRGDGQDRTLVGCSEAARRHGHCRKPLHRRGDSRRGYRPRGESDAYSPLMERIVGRATLLTSAILRALPPTRCRTTSRPSRCRRGPSRRTDRPGCGRCAFRSR